MADPPPARPTDAPAPRRKYVPVVGPRLKILLSVVFALFAVLMVNSTYLAAITFTQWVTGETIENYFYIVMFALHLALGLAIVVPVVVFGIVHMRNAWNRPNRRAAAAGYALFAVALLLLLTGLVLMRLDVGGVTLALSDPAARSVVYWLHVITPLVASWLFVLHRLAGRRIKWRTGIQWAVVAIIVAVVGVLVHAQDPRAWNRVGPASGPEYFEPSPVRTATGDFIDADVLNMNEYCLECHPQVHAQWADSAHAFSSFNNPAYAFSIREMREIGHNRDGSMQSARWCAACHDPVPFLSGAFDDPRYDSPLYDVATDPLGSASITCTVCHAITHINSPRGNGDYTIEEPIHYPFATSDNPVLSWINRQLVKAKPAFHQRTFLKPLHQSTEFCGVCHKVSIPPEVNDYKWLRGQDHYDSFLQSGVSGHGIMSWYYPPEAESNCNGCHMPLRASDEFGARRNDDSGELTVHDHLFPSANTAMPIMTGNPRAKEIIAAHEAFNEGVMRVDLFALRDGGDVDGPLLGPLRPEVPEVQVGRRYLLEAVVRTLKMGHLFTQGTADSNQVWLDVEIRSGTRVIGRTGGMNDEGVVDPWSPFLNTYMLDRDGNRIDRRNVADIFVPLYNHQIPPGAAEVVHLAFEVPDGLTGPIEIEASLRYRKFDTTFMRYVYEPEFENDLPVMTLATDRLVLPTSSWTGSVPPQESEVEAWERWNDYGIGLFRKGDKGQLRQAEEAFDQVEAAGQATGPLNLARVFIKEGRLDEAVDALGRAAAHDPPALPWSVAWFSGVVSRQLGDLDRAIASFRQVVESRFEGAEERGFDFSKDVRVLQELGQALFERARQERRDEAARTAMLEEAVTWMQRALEIDPEYQPAHWGLYQVYTQLGRTEDAAASRALHDRYRVDENARDRAITRARQRDPAADHASEAIVIYDLQRPGAFGLPTPVRRTAGHE